MKKLWLSLVVCFSSSMNAVNVLGELPPEIILEIAAFCNGNSQGWDLVIVKKSFETLRALSQVNKYFYKVINDDKTFPYLLRVRKKGLSLNEDLFAPFPLPNNEILTALAMGTATAQCWLNKTHDFSGDYDLFKAVQKILKVSSDIGKELEIKGFSSYKVSNRLDLHDRRRTTGSIMWYTGKETGFVVPNEPSYLITPWGQVVLLELEDDLYFKTDKLEMFENSRRAFSLLFSEKIGIAFKDIVLEDILFNHDVRAIEAVEISKVDWSSDRTSCNAKRIKDNDYTTYIGSNVFFITDNDSSCGRARYDIVEVDGYKIIKKEGFKTVRYRYDQKSQMLWDFLLHRYRKEQAEIKKISQDSKIH